MLYLRGRKSFKTAEIWQFQVYLVKMMRFNCVRMNPSENEKGLSGMLIKAVKTYPLDSWQSQQVRIRSFLSPFQPLVRSCWNTKTSCRGFCKKLMTNPWWFLKLIRLFGILDSNSLCDLGWLFILTAYVTMICFHHLPPAPAPLQEVPLPLACGT